jgi:hypothetical protein
VKRDLVRLFQDCVYLNIQGLSKHSMGVDVTREGRKCWPAVVRAVEGSGKGLPIGGAIEIQLLVETKEAIGMPTELHYAAGMLSGRDRSLGHDVISLQVGPEFREAIVALHRIAVEKERRDWGGPPP